MCEAASTAEMAGAVPHSTAAFDNQVALTYAVGLLEKLYAHCTLARIPVPGDVKFANK